jgi:hypothetical protein
MPGLCIKTKVFGDDVAFFRPERWLEDKEKSAGMWKYMLHFGAGSHLCFGRNIAMLEMYKFFRIFLKNFKINCSCSSGKHYGLIRVQIELNNPEKEWTLYNMSFVKAVDILGP